MRILPTLVLITSALAAILFECEAFEEPSSNDISWTISNKEVDTSVLIYNLKDIVGTNIPIRPVSLQNTNDDFEICTEELKSQDVCDTVGEYVIKFIKYKNGYTRNENTIYNALLKAGEEYTYRIKAQGGYCIVGYQEGEIIKGLTVEANHLYGKFGLSYYVEYTTVLVALLLEVILLIVSKTLSVKDESVPHSVIKNFLKVSSFAHLLKSVSLAILNVHSGYIAKQRTKLFNAYVDVFESIFYWVVLFGASLNKAVLYNNFKEDAKLIKSNARFKILYSSYAIISLIQVSRIPLPPIVWVLLSLINEFIWIPMLSIVHRNYKDTLDKLVNFENMKDYARSYKISRHLMLGIAVFTSLIMPFNLITDCFGHVFKSSNSNINELDVLTNIFASSLVGNFTYSALLISTIPDFSIGLISLGLLIIWKPFNMSLKLDPVYNVDVTAAKNE